MSNEKDMSLQYDSLSEGKHQKCKEMYPNWQVCTCRNVKDVHSTREKREILPCRNKE